MFGQVQDSVHGSFCGYHFELALENLVSAGWILPSAVTKWPVATTYGTAQGLNRLCKTKVTSPKLLSEMLNELLVRLRNPGKLTWKDVAGTIGAALCWAKRNKLPGRYHKTTSSSDLELLQLSQVGLLQALLPSVP